MPPAQWAPLGSLERFSLRFKNHTGAKEVTRAATVERMRCVHGGSSHRAERRPFALIHNEIEYGTNWGESDANRGIESRRGYALYMSVQGRTLV